MALSPELKAAIDAELAEVKGLDVAAELASLNEPEVIEEAPQEVDPATPEPAPDLSALVTPADPNSISSAIGRGVDTMQSNIGGTIATLGELTGSDYLKDYGTQMAEENAQEASQYGTPDVRSFADIQDIPSIGSFLKNNIVEALPSMAPVLAGGAAGAKAGSVFGAPGRMGGALIGSFLSSMGINVGALSNQMKELDPDQSNPWTAVLGGAGLSALDTAGAGVIAGPLLKHLGKDGAYHMLVQSGLPKQTAIEAVTQAGKHAVVSGVAEGVTSGAQQALQDTIAYDAVGQTQSPEQFMDNLLTAAFTGTAMGTAGGAVSSGMDTLGRHQDSAGSAVVDPNAPEAPPKSSEFEPRGTVKKAWDALGNEATSLLEPLAKASPIAREFSETFRADMSGKRASGKTIFEDQELQAGKWNSELDNIFEGKSSKEIDRIIADTSAGVNTPEATRLRSLMDDVRNEAVNRGGMSVGTIPNYMPFGLSPEKVQTPEFLEEITPYFQNRQAAEDAVANWLVEVSDDTRGNTAPEVNRLVTQNQQTGAWEVDPRYRIQGDPDTLRGRFAQSDAVPKYGQLEESRAFGSVPQEILNKYSLNDTPKKRLQEIRDYFEGASHRIAFTERFGINGEKANAKIASAVAEAQRAGKRVTKEEVDRMYDLVDAYNGMHGRIKDPNLKKLAAVTSGALVLSRLPLAGFSTLTEFSLPFAKAGVMPTLGAVLPTMGEVVRQAARRIYSGIPKSETGRFMSDMNHTLASATSLMADRVGAEVFNSTIQKTIRGQFLINGLSILTHVNRIFATETAKRVYQNNLMDLAAGLPFSSANGALKVAQLREMGVNIGSQQDALKLISPATPSEVLMANNVKTLAMRRFVDQVVLDPTFADKPMWMSNGNVQMFSLLKGYPAAYGNIILPMFRRRMSPHFAGSWTNAGMGAAGVAFTLGLMMSLGYLQDELRQLAKFGGSSREDTRSPEQRMMDVVMQQMPLQASMIYDMLTGYRRGTTPAEVLLGPVAGAATEGAMAVGKTIASFGDDPSAGEIWKFLYKQTPARPFVAGMEAMEDALDL
ncbi:virion structural protein [Pseudomonas phage vB_PaeP_SIIA-P2]